MNITNAQRLKKLMLHLVTRPQFLCRYARYHFFWHKMPLDIGLPWWSFEAIDKVAMFCKGTDHVFEYGTGGSTLFFSQRCASVTCVEDDRKWLELVTQNVQNRTAANITLLHRPFDFRNPLDFEHSSYLLTLSAQQRALYEIIVVDGQDWTFNERPVCFQYAEQFIKPGGLIVVDDSWRYPQLRVKNHALRVEVCQGVGPCRLGVTSTDLYFY